MAAIRLRVSEALPRDVGRSLARVDPTVLEELGLSLGDTVTVAGRRRTVCRLMPAHREQRGQGRVQLDGVTRSNCGAALEEEVELTPVACKPARRLVLEGFGGTSPEGKELAYLAGKLDGLSVVAGDRVRVALFAGRSTDFTVQSVEPPGPAIVQPGTLLELAAAGHAERRPGGRISYEDIGGLKPQMSRIREMIELPLRHPEAFERLGISAPKGVLLHGPPGCGKTLIARAIAEECEARFYSISGPEIIHKFYGESEAHLRKVFEEAARTAPSIIFLDEIDAIAPRREKAAGEVEKRVVAQLLVLMDGLKWRGRVVVIGATNLPNSLDPALRRPGRFDREIQIPVPDAAGRQEILELNCRGMPLAEDVDLSHLASITHGYVGADLEALCREAAMTRLRAMMGGLESLGAGLPYGELESLRVERADFLAAHAEIEPSAIREVWVERPRVRWADVGGLESAKQILREAVEWPLRHGPVLERAGVKPPKGVLLSGPPGCGKTLLAKALACESGVNLVAVQAASLLSKYVGESEAAVRDVFRKARNAAPCIVFFDEADALLSARGGGASDSPVTERVLLQFLTELDGLEDLRNVLVLAATNRPDRLDAAVLRPGRFDHLVPLALPDVNGRCEIFVVHLRGRPLVAGVDIDALAAGSEGFSGARIAHVCDEAARAAVRRALRDGAGGAADRVRITHDDLLAALERERTAGRRG